jgi:hypothetical protein
MLLATSLCASHRDAAAAASSTPTSKQAASENEHYDVGKATQQRRESDTPASQKIPQWRLADAGGRSYVKEDLWPTSAL